MITTYDIFRPGAGTAVTIEWSEGNGSWLVSVKAPGASAFTHTEVEDWSDIPDAVAELEAA